MNAGRARLVVAAVIATATTAGCGFGPGPSSEGEATLTVTRDYGAEPMLEATESDPPESETVLRMLDGEAEIETRYGGGFVQSIDGVAGAVEDGRTSDWFFFVNGIESDRGAAEVPVRGGDRIWWDYRDWTEALRTPAVVGSWPEPFAQESAGAEAMPVRVVCFAKRQTCGEVAERLATDGVDSSIEGPEEAAAAGRRAPALRLLVGSWPTIDSDPAAAQLARGPQTSGVFARFERGPGGWRLEALDPGGDPAARLGSGAGLVAAVREGDDPATWLVTGTDEAGVAEAASLLDSDGLSDHYAVAAARGDGIPVPAAEESG
jgi:Domain of unknown function (DUF4430)